MNLYNAMLDSTKNLYEEIYKHPFVQGIGNCSIPKEKFIYYMIQDYSYLIDYLKVFSIGAAKAPHRNEMQFILNLVSNAINDEMDMHLDYLHKLGVNDNEVLTAKQSLTNISYTSFMLKTAYESDFTSILAAILPCESTYCMIGKRLLKDYPDSANHPLYGEWITTYSNPAMESTLMQITTILNQLTKNYAEDNLQKLIEIFEISTRYEKEFWEMSWNLT